MLEQLEMQSHQVICWNSLKCEVIEVYFEQPEIQSYQGIYWNSLKYKIIRVLVGPSCQGTC